MPGYFDCELETRATSTPLPPTPTTRLDHLVDYAEVLFLLPLFLILLLPLPSLLHPPPAAVAAPPPPPLSILQLELEQEDVVAHQLFHRHHPPHY